MNHKQRWADGGMWTYVARLRCTEHCLVWLRPDIYVPCAKMAWSGLGQCYTKFCSYSMLPCHWMQACLMVHDIALGHRLDIFILSFQTMEQVCPVCCQHVLRTVIIQYYPCCCVRRRCPDCDAALEKSGTDSCDIHFFSSRKTPQQRKKKMCKWPLFTSSCT